MSYFAENASSKWSLSDAYSSYKKRNPDKSTRELLQAIKYELNKLQKGQNEKKAAKASVWIKKWSKMVKDLEVPSSSDSSNRTPTQNVELTVSNNSIRMIGSNVSIGTMTKTSSLPLPSSSSSSISSMASTVPPSTSSVTPSSTLAAQSTVEQAPSTPLHNQATTDQESNRTKRNIDSLLELNDDSFDNHKRRRYIINYMINVDRSWEPLTRWNLYELDITEKFQQFRNRSILLADAKHNISDNRLLSLSNIFTITPCQSNSCLHRFSPIYYKSVVKAIKRKQNWASLPFPARTWCGMVDELIGQSTDLPVKRLYALIRKFGNASASAFDGENEDENDEDTDGDGNEEDVDVNNSGRDHANSENNDNDDDDDTGNVDDLLLTTNILNCLVGVFQNWIGDCVFESSFVEQRLSPFMNPIFRRISVTLRLGETHINNDPTSLLADYVGSYQATSGDRFDVVTCEVKPCNKTSNSQAQSDFVKLGKEMKQMVDRLIDYGLESPVVVGVLVEGHRVKTYSMRLVEHGCYILYEHGSFALLHSPQDVHGVPIIMEHLIQLASILKDTLKDIDTRSTSSETNTNSSIDWKRQTSGTAIRTSDQR